DDVQRVLEDGNFCASILDGCEAIVHLAAISNDPSAEINPLLTHAVNCHATLALAREARRRGIRFIFSSSCSVYGHSPELLDEASDVRPLTAYATSKVAAEKGLWDLADGSWRPIVLRNGTLFGLSPRMRFDLVVNIFSLHGALRREIAVFGSGA